MAYPNQTRGAFRKRDVAAIFVNALIHSTRKSGGHGAPTHYRIAADANSSLAIAIGEIAMAPPRSDT
jgi:hypothetical protein